MNVLLAEVEGGCARGLQVCDSSVAAKPLGERQTGRCAHGQSWHGSNFDFSVSGPIDYHVLHLPSITLLPIAILSLLSSTRARRLALLEHCLALSSLPLPSHFEALDIPAHSLFNALAASNRCSSHRRMPRGFCDYGQPPPTTLHLEICRPTRTDFG